MKFKKRISNPMTVIAIFAALSETSAAVSLPFLDNNQREIYVWFLISFPFYLLFLFFLTLNFNHRSLYAPSDFDKEENFIKIIDGAERSESRKLPYPEEWPVQLKDLSIIDTRTIDTKADITALLEKIREPREHATKVVVFLACTESERLLKESALKYTKHRKKGAYPNFCIVYNLNSQGVTVLDQA